MRERALARSIRVASAFKVPPNCVQASVKAFMRPLETVNKFTTSSGVSFHFLVLMSRLTTDRSVLLL